MKLKDMPIEWLEQILSRCSIRDLHRHTMRVNKEWEEATRYVLKQRKTLKIGDVTEKQEDDSDLDWIWVRDWYDSERIIKSLVKTMTGIEDLEMDRLSDFDPMSWGPQCNVQDYFPLVLRMSANLKSLKIAGVLPLGRRVRYPKLERLECCDFESPDAAKACPRLKHLQSNGTMSPSALLSLRPEIIESLVANVSHMPGHEVKELVDHLLKMQKAKKLVVRVITDTNESVAQELFRLFRGFQDLKHFEVRAWNGIESLGADAAVAELVRLNPGIKHLDLNGFAFTEKSLNYLSRLQHLDYLSLRSVKLPDNRPDHVLEFMRGSASRSGLEGLVIGFKERVDCQAIIEEMRVIEREGGEDLVTAESEDGMEIVFDFFWRFH